MEKTEQNRSDMLRILRNTKVGRRANTDSRRQPIAVAIDHISPEVFNALPGGYFRVCRICAYNPTKASVESGNPTGCPYYKACMSRYRPDRLSVVFMSINRLRGLTLLCIDPYRKHLFHLDNP